MDFLLQNWLGLLLMMVLVVGWIYLKKKERDKDAVTDYSKQDLGGNFSKLQNGETWLTFEYDKITQQRKKQYILDNYSQGMEVKNIHGYLYYISELISNAYYEIVYDENNNVKSKTGPYVAYKVVPKTEMKQSNINIDRTSGPVQVTTGNSIAYQCVENSSFSNKVYEYKDLMINNGILKEDIEVVINYPEDNDIKQSFLSKYGLELAKITVSIAGTVVSLLSLLKS
ncbi:hypothetical protein [Listeria booriae]|uniref:hypothetical protein n=1 Tax=Listeria booriae TaxID=1552123 RepID=UPI001623DE30|nr:hypothetical protein [Listeria booriae]MBC2676753.1 hypothetical protein [Listeria booriae]